jgi:hypothetical protein
MVRRNTNGNDRVDLIIRNVYFSIGIEINTEAEETVKTMIQNASIYCGKEKNMKRKK